VKVGKAILMGIVGGLAMTALAWLARTAPQPALRSGPAHDGLFHLRRTET
jgi:hypothetical protein